MIVILCENEHRQIASSIGGDLQAAYRDQLQVSQVLLGSQEKWQGPPSWDDLLILLFGEKDLEANGKGLVHTYLRDHSTTRHVLPVALSPSRNAPPEPLSNLKALPFDEQAKGPQGRIANRVGAMLGLRLRARESKVFISYRASDGTVLARQLHDHLKSHGYEVWLDEDRDEFDGETSVLPGLEVQAQIDENLNDANVILLVDTPAAPTSWWIKHEVDAANGQLVPILPLCFKLPGDTRQGPRFRSLWDLRRWVELPLPPGPGQLSGAELEFIQGHMEQYLCEIFRRKCRVPFVVEKQFTSRQFGWKSLDKRLFMFESVKSYNPRLHCRVVTHCSFFDQVYPPAVRVFANFLAATPRGNHSLFVYDGQLVPAPQLSEISAQAAIEGAEEVVLLHHQELPTLIDSDFTMLPT